MTRAEIEDTVVSKLHGQLSEVQVEAFPDEPGKFNPKRSSVILVAYDNKRRQSESNNRGTRQVNNRQVVLTFLYRNRRTHQGVLGDLGTVEDTLTGWRVDGQFMKLSEERFVTYDKQRQRWVYTQRYDLAERYNNT